MTLSPLVKKEPIPDSPDNYTYFDHPSSPINGTPGAANGSNSDSKKKRIGKACDSCRIKKCRCDGRKPCSKCTADNKICVYSERKKPRDKVYPSGYVDLLETRLDLLTKSLEKLIDLSLEGTNLAFLKTPGEKFGVNKIINHLVTDYGLLDNQPVEWDTATKLLAQLPDDAEGIIQISNQYLEHAKQLSLAAENAAAMKLKDKKERKRKNNTASKRRSSSQLRNSTVKDEPSPSPDLQNSGSSGVDLNDPAYASSLNIKTEFDDELDQLKTDFTLKGFQPKSLPDLEADFSATPQLDLGPFSSGAAILALAMEGGLSMSDFESDNNINASNFSPVASNSPFSEFDWGNGSSNTVPIMPQTASSLFLDTGNGDSTHDLLSGNSSVYTSSTQIFNENPPSNVHVNPGSPRLEPQLRRSNSRPYSLTTAVNGKKLVNNHSGQIAKPHHHSHHHQKSTGSIPLRRTYSNTNSNPSPENLSLQSPSGILSSQLLGGDELSMLDMIALSPTNNSGPGANTISTPPATTANLNAITTSDKLDGFWLNQD